MVVFSNQRIGPGVELLVSEDVAVAVLRGAAREARTCAQARWEVELVHWLDGRADAIAVAGHATLALDVSEIAWTRDHFESQRRFLIDVLARAAGRSEHPAAIDRWRHMIEAHPRESVQFGRRWQRQPTA